MEIVLVDFFKPTSAFFTAVEDPKLSPKFSVADLWSDLLTRVSWLSESIKHKTATMGIKRIFFSLLAISLLWLFDLIPRSIKYLGGTGVITNQLGHHPLGGWRTCQKNEKGFQGDLLGEWLVHELKIRPLHGAIYWFAQVFLHRRGAPGCSSSGTVASSQPSTRSAGVLLPWFLILWSSASSVKYFAHSRLEREVIIGEKYFLTVVDKERKKQQQKKKSTKWRWSCWLQELSLKISKQSETSVCFQHMLPGEGHLIHIRQMLKGWVTVKQITLF